MGRVATLETPTTLETIVSRVKKHCNLSNVRVAVAPHRFQYDNKKDISSQVDLSTVKIETVAVCAGSGSTVLRGCEADVYVTGEMSHHDVLACNASGVSVILCDHTNTERGYLEVFKKQLSDLVRDIDGGDDVEFRVSVLDSDPLVVV
jgi:putative NIF3 family GTP cyclohydrolase 1 type 2